MSRFRLVDRALGDLGPRAPRPAPQIELMLTHPIHTAALRIGGAVLVGLATALVLPFPGAWAFPAVAGVALLGHWMVPVGLWAATALFFLLGPSPVPAAGAAAIVLLGAATACLFAWSGLPWRATVERRALIRIARPVLGAALVAAAAYLATALFTAPTPSPLPPRRSPPRAASGCSASPAPPDRPRPPRRRMLRASSPSPFALSVAATYRLRF